MSERVLPALLLALGLAQMAGAAFDVRALRGLAAATAASPAPKVFSAVGGFETYSTAFTIRYAARDGTERRVPVTRERYAELEGPYNRRNTYGALVAYGPVLIRDPASRAMFDAAATYALCGARPLLRELGIDAAEVVGDVTLELSPRAGTPSEFARTLRVRCRR